MQRHYNKRCASQFGTINSITKHQNTCGICRCLGVNSHILHKKKGGKLNPLGFEKKVISLFEKYSDWSTTSTAWTGRKSHANNPLRLTAKHFPLWAKVCFPLIIWKMPPELSPSEKIMKQYFFIFFVNLWAFPGKLVKVNQCLRS